MTAPTPERGDACPTACDPDCSVACHEVHQVETKRNHDVRACIQRQCAPERGECRCPCHRTTVNGVLAPHVGPCSCTVMSAEAVDVLNEVRDGDLTRMRALMDADPIPERGDVSSEPTAEGLTEVERRAVVGIVDGIECDYLTTADAFGVVERILADRLAAVRAERDAWEAEAESSAVAAGNALTYRRRAESAEAERDDLRSALDRVKALADEWECILDPRHLRSYCWACEASDALRAILAAHPEPPEADPTAGGRELRPSFGSKPEGECVVALEDLPAEPDAGDVEALIDLIERETGVDGQAAARAVLASDWLASDRAATAERALDALIDQMCDCGDFDGHPGDCAATPVINLRARIARGGRPQE